MSRGNGSLVSQVFTLLPEQKALMEDASMRFNVTQAQIAREAINLYLLNKGYPKEVIPNPIQLPTNANQKRPPRLLDLPGMPPPASELPPLNTLGLDGVLAIRSDSLGPYAPPPPPTLSPLERHFFYYDEAMGSSMPISESELEKKVRETSWFGPVVLKGESAWKTIQDYFPNLLGYKTPEPENGVAVGSEGGVDTP